jgi:hypothetical protein
MGSWQWQVKSLFLKKYLSVQYGLKTTWLIWPLKQRFYSLISHDYPRDQSGLAMPK